MSVSKSVRVDDWKVDIKIKDSILSKACSSVFGDSRVLVGDYSLLESGVELGINGVIKEILKHYKCKKIHKHKGKDCTCLDMVIDKFCESVKWNKVKELL